MRQHECGQQQALTRRRLTQSLHQRLIERIDRALGYELLRRVKQYLTSLAIQSLSPQAIKELFFQERLAQPVAWLTTRDIDAD